MIDIFEIVGIYQGPHQSLFIQTSCSIGFWVQQVKLLIYLTSFLTLNAAILNPKHRRLLIIPLTGILSTIWRFLKAAGTVSTPFLNLANFLNSSVLRYRCCSAWYDVLFATFTVATLIYIWEPCAPLYRIKGHIDAHLGQLEEFVSCHSLAFLSCLVFLHSL